MRLIVLLHSKTKSTESGTLELEPPPSVLSLQDWGPTIKKIAGVASALAIVSGIAIWYGTQSGPVYEYRDLTIVTKHSDLHYTLKKDDGLFTVHFCEDYKPDLQVGFVLWKFRYEDRGDCISVARADLGYWYKRDASTGLAIKEQ